MMSPLPQADYYAIVSRRRGGPGRPLPLDNPRSPADGPGAAQGGRSDVPLDLQAAFTAVYDRARYDLSLNYNLDLQPPLGDDAAAWVRGLLPSVNRNARSGVIGLAPFFHAGLVVHCARASFTPGNWRSAWAAPAGRRTATDERRRQNGAYVGPGNHHVNQQMDNRNARTGPGHRQPVPDDDMVSMAGEGHDFGILGGSLLMASL